LRAGAILQKRAQENPKIAFIWDSVPVEVIGDRKVEKIRLKNVKTGTETDFLTDGLFVFIGHTPNTQLFQGQITLDERGYIVVDSLMQTNIPGVYAGGEVADPHYRQVVTSAGMGAAAGIQVTRFLEDLLSKQ
ncbi:MAG TPA: FAD-dependent oxidoreductase, partial [Longilinea sp.]|nr:FAD-dependent oxidoreductase [Longilinea sp.]